MIRGMNAVDLDRVMEIWLESTIVGHPFIEEAYWKKNATVVRESYIPQSEVFVHEAEEKILGFIAIVGNRHVGALFTDPKAFNKGIGTGLMDYARAHYERLTVAVYIENEKAINFYKHRGFKVESEHKEEESGHQEYIMAWEV